MYNCEIIFIFIIINDSIKYQMILYILFQVVPIYGIVKFFEQDVEVILNYE